MKNSIFISLLFVFSIGISPVFSQTTTITHNVPFATDTIQNMWGPTFGAVSLDQEITLFEQSWNTGFNTGSSGIITLAGQSFGAGFAGNFSGLIGSKISIKGFTLGTVEVDYPIDVSLTYDQDSTYDQGDSVTIETDYTVSAGWDLTTNYPSAGEFFWDLYFQMAADASATLCAFGCTTFPIIPSFNTGLINLNLMAISSNGASTGGEYGIWYLGPGATPPYVGGGNTDPSYPGTEVPYGIWPYAVPPGSGSFGSGWIPWQVHIPSDMTIELPAIAGEIGLSGGLTIPYVETTDQLVGQNLNACGDSTYFDIQLEIFDLLGTILGEVLVPPYDVIGDVLSNLQGEYELAGGLATVSWTFFTAYFEGTITNKQCFDFTPTVYGDFEFPIAVDYKVKDTTGSVIETGQSSIVSIELGQDIEYAYPCYFEEFDITPTYSIDGQFRNHTWDDVQFTFNMGAFAFALEVPPITVIPAFTIPEICVPIPYPCPSWSCPWCWCTYTACTPEINVPCVCYSGLSLIYPGPTTEDYLWSYTIPLGGFQYDWFDQTWSLGGFSDTTFVPFTMRANPLGISNTFTDVSCNGGNDGAINVTTSAVSPYTPYTYTWTNGTVTSPGGTTTSLTNLPAGPYEVSVIDGHGCQMFTGATIEEPQPLVASYTKSDISCNAAGDGSINVTVTGGNGGNTYNWTPAVTWTPGGSGGIASGLGAGTYSLTVTDSKGCTDNFSVTITEPNVLGQTAAITDVDCKGDSTGSIDVSSYGGTLPYTFSWNTSPAQTSEDIDSLLAGTYTMTLTDVKGCTSVQNYTVNEPAAVVSLSVVSTTDVSCKYGSDGAINLATAGGTPGYTYVWSNNVSGVLPFTTEDITNIPAADYTITATDSKGCQASLTQTIDEPSAPLSSTPTTVDILCFGDATGSIDPGIAGGTPGYTYSWSTGATTATLTNITAGTYTLDVLDSKGCTDTYTYTLNEPSAPLNVILTGTDVLCFGESTGSVSSTVTGGTGGYSYLWNTGATTSSISNIAAGNYDVVVTDDNGCTANDATVVNEPAAPLSLSSVVTDVDCFGNNSGAVDMSVTGGTYPYAQQWSNGGTVIMSDTTQDISSQYAGNYTVLVTDANGCQDTLTSVISQPSAPLEISGVTDDVNCYGLNDGSIDITVTGGTTTYNYNWSNGATTEDITSLVANTYSVDVTDANGCLESMTFVIDQPVAPLTVVTFVSDVKCNGSDDGSVESEVTGGTSPYTYAWSNSETIADIDNLTAGVYTLTVTDAQGCTAFTGATVNEPAALVMTPVITDVSCYGYADGEVVLNITGGVQPYYFTWGNNNEIMLNNPSETLSNLVASNYLARVRDANGCMVEQVLTVNQPQPFIATHIVSDVLCYGGSDGSIDLTVTGGTSPYVYLWNDGQTVEDAVNLPTGDYEVTITDAQGCEITDTAFVDEPEEIQIWSETTTASCIDQDDGVIYVTPFGGIPPYSYLWSNGSVELDPGELGPGMYDLTITDDHLCTQTFNFEIEINYDECLDVPNTFTPNGDLYNDTWIIENIDLYPNAEVKVFNKWGNLVYSTKGEYIPWDGTFNGNPMPSEVYYYIIILNNTEDNQYTGNVTIVR